MIESYLSGGDIHAEVAQSLETSRETAKEAEFSILFGSEGYAIANSMGIPIERARKYVEDFPGKYPRIKALRDRVYSLADEYSQAFTAFGRVRKLGYAKHEGEIKERRRQAWNYFAQSSAGEIIKKVILDIKRANIPGVSIKATVFDSILVFVPSEEAAREIDAVVKRSLKFSCRGRVWEFRFESGVGKTWLEAKENNYDFYAALGDTNKLGLGMDVNLNPETAKYLKLNKAATDKFATLDTGDFLGINNIDPAQAKYYNDLANLLGLNTITGVTDEQARLGAMGYNSQGYIS